LLQRYLINRKEGKEWIEEELLDVTGKSLELGMGLKAF
jgi:hypothetical protein